MESQLKTAPSMPAGPLRHRRGAATSDNNGGIGNAVMGSALLDPAKAAMAIISRCANHTLSQQLENAYAAAAQARDYAKTAAAAARDCPPGPARDALVAAWARQEADADRLMGAVLRFGREHGHLAFAFSVCG